MDPKKRTRKKPHKSNKQKGKFNENHLPQTPKLLGRTVSGPGYWQFRPGGWRDPPFPNDSSGNFHCSRIASRNFQIRPKWGKQEKRHWKGGVGCTSVFLVFPGFTVVQKTESRGGYFCWGFKREVKIASYNISGWWFQIFSMFIPIWGNDPIWLVFFKRVETTN